MVSLAHDLWFHGLPRVKPVYNESGKLEGGFVAWLGNVWLFGRRQKG